MFKLTNESRKVTNRANSQANSQAKSSSILYTYYSLENYSYKEVSTTICICLNKSEKKHWLLHMYKYK